MAHSFKECFDFLLRQDVNLDELTQKGLTPLNFAVNIKHRYFVSQLLASGADSTIPDAKGRLPLFHAADLECEEIVDLLLENGSPTCYLDSDCLPIVAALERNNMRILSLLIQSGADPNGGKKRPLEMAIKQKKVKAVELLLAAGADTTGISCDHAPSSIAQLLNQWKVDEAVEVDRMVLDSRVRFEELKAICNDFLAKSESPSMLDGFLTPVIGGINELVVRITDYAMSMEYTARCLRQARLELLTKQFKYLEEGEKKELREEFRKDESAWVELVQWTQERLLKSGIAEKFRVFAEKMSQVEDALFDTADSSLAIPFKENRKELLMWNKSLAEFKKIVTECHHIIQAVSDRIVDVLEKIDDIISSMLKLIISQQQMNFEFESLHKGSSVSQVVEDHLEERKSTLNTDKAFVAYEKKQFIEHSKNILQMIRHCTN